MFEDYPDILSPEEAAEALRIGENAIYELLNSKNSAPIKRAQLADPKGSCAKICCRAVKAGMIHKTRSESETIRALLRFLISSRIPCKVLSMLSL